MSGTSINEYIQLPGASLPLPPAPSPPQVVSSSISENNWLEKQKSTNRGNARPALAVPIEEETKPKPTKHIKDCSAPIIENSSGVANGCPSSSGVNIIRQQNTKKSIQLTRILVLIHRLSML